MAALSKSQIDKLGERIRDAALISSDDLALLQDLRRAHDEVVENVAARLRTELGLQPVSRLKTVGTIVDKLRRERMRLTQMQDIAGIRVVQDVDLVDQDSTIKRICSLFPDAKVVDRRVAPSHGYRAVHVIVSQGGQLVEIQVRTELQHLWAQTVEGLADRFGRGLRYGETPEGLSDSDLDNIKDLLFLSGAIAHVEESERSLRALRERWSAPGAPEHPVLVHLAFLARTTRDGLRQGFRGFLMGMGQSSL